MNKCIFMGNLTKDMETAVTQAGLSIAKGSMALDKGKDKDGNSKGADFINLTAFGVTADTLGKYGRKGKRFLVETHVTTGSYEKDGQKHYTTDFVIDRFEFADKAEKPAEASNSDFMSIPEDIAEELPFE